MTSQEETEQGGYFSTPFHCEVAVPYRYYRMFAAIWATLQFALAGLRCEYVLIHSLQQDPFLFSPLFQGAEH